MDRYELELKSALARREPSVGFTSRVMQAVGRESAVGPVEAPVWRAGRRWRWAAVGALAASLSFGFVVEKRRSDRRAAQAAEAQVYEAQIYEALLLVGSKIHHAREAVQGPLAGVAESAGGAEQ